MKHFPSQLLLLLVLAHHLAAETSSTEEQTIFFYQRGVAANCSISQHQLGLRTPRSTLLVEAAASNPHAMLDFHLLVGSELLASADTCPFALFAFSQVMVNTHVGHPRLREVAEFAESAIDKLIGTVTDLRVRVCWRACVRVHVHV